MAHKAMMNGTEYEIAGGKAMMNGTVYGVDSGKAMSGGTVYPISFGPKICSVKIDLNVLEEPNGANYEQTSYIGVGIYDSNRNLIDGVGYHNWSSGSENYPNTGYNWIFLGTGSGDRHNITKTVEAPKGAHMYMRTSTAGTAKANYILRRYRNGVLVGGDIQLTGTDTEYDLGEVTGNGTVYFCNAEAENLTSYGDNYYSINVRVTMEG